MVTFVGTHEQWSCLGDLARRSIDYGDLNPLLAESAHHATGHAVATDGISRQAMWSAAMDVGEWLKGICLGQYEATLRAHDIDVDVLADATKAALEKIGLPLEASKRLMKAIANPN